MREPPHRGECSLQARYDQLLAWPRVCSCGILSRRFDVSNLLPIQRINPPHHFADRRLGQVFPSLLAQLAVDHRIAAVDELGAAFGDGLDQGVQLAAGEEEGETLAG